MIKNKKILIHIALIALLLVVIATGTVLTLQSVRDNRRTTENTTQSTPLNADALRDQALQAAKNNEIVKAKDLLQQARRIYIDTDNLNGVAGTDAQLYLLDHPRE